MVFILRRLRRSYAQLRRNLATARNCAAVVKKVATWGVIDEHTSNESFKTRFQSNVSLTVQNKFAVHCAINVHRPNESFGLISQSNFSLTSQHKFRMHGVTDEHTSNQNFIKNFGRMFRSLYGIDLEGVA
jgi:hypothetical protein